MLRVSIIYNKPSIKCLQVFLQMEEGYCFQPNREGCSGSLVFVHENDRLVDIVEYIDKMYR